MKLTLYSRPGCHLCEAALDELRRLETHYPHEREIVDITTDPALLQHYGERIPVVQAGGQEVSAPLNRSVLERLLRTAR